MRYFTQYWADYAEGDTSPLPLDSLTHDGIEIQQSECCTEFLYRHGDQWVRLAGMD
jgi:hypothetical protein